MAEARVAAAITALATIVAALVSGIFLIIATQIEHSDRQPSPPPTAPPVIPESPAPVPPPRAPAPTALQPEPRHVWPTEVVWATQKWKRTEIWVRKGEKIKITATGEVVSNTDVGERPVGPDGHPGRPEIWQYNVLPGENHAALIGRIDSVDGDIGPTFFIGKEYNRRMDRTGVLVLGVNDRGVKNNSGEFMVNVVVMP